MYQKVDTKLDFASREGAVAQFWKDNKVIKKMIEKNKNGDLYTFYEGPPTANGKYFQKNNSRDLQKAKLEFVMHRPLFT